MLRLETTEHENVARGSFPVRIDFDVYHPRTCGWLGYTQVSEQMQAWCRERWGPSVSECAVYREDEDGRPRLCEPIQARWMICGKSLYVRDRDQALEARMRWHGASR